MKKFKVGILGAGFGERVVLPCVEFIDNMEVKYIYCRNTKKIKNKENLKYVTNDYKKILNDKEINLIFIETPPYTHKKFLIESIKHNKNVFCEKPLSANLKDAKIMLGYVKNKKNFAFVNHQLRFHPNILKMRKLIKNGFLGKINYSTIEHHTNMIDEKNTENWWFNKKSGGGQVLALGSHMIDLLFFLNGEIKKVHSLKGNFLKNKGNKKFLWKKKVESFFTMICEFKNESIGNINCSCISSVDSGLNIIISGEKGTLKLNNFDKLVFENSNGNSRNISVKDSLRSEKIIGVNPWRTALVKYLQHITKNSDNRKKFLGADFSQALKTQIIMDKIIKN